MVSADMRESMKGGPEESHTQLLQAFLLQWNSRSVPLKQRGVTILLHSPLRATCVTTEVGGNYLGCVLA